VDSTNAVLTIGNLKSKIAGDLIQLNCTTKGASIIAWSRNSIVFTLNHAVYEKFRDWGGGIVILVMPFK
jgi:hypothetical protein